MDEQTIFCSKKGSRIAPNFRRLEIYYLQPQAIPGQSDIAATPARAAPCRKEGRYDKTNRSPPTRLPQQWVPIPQAVTINGLLFTSGQLPIDPATSTMIEGSIGEKAALCLENIGNIAKAAGTSLQNAVKVTVFLADMNDFAAVNEVYKEYFAEPFPARSAIQVAAPAPSAERSRSKPSWPCRNKRSRTGDSDARTPCHAIPARHGSR